ncbi:nitroreductase [Salsuginibacillus halophilus]|uniref:Nitroreductase n=1 Tax=Salsuginibacillus halophilus TaxID=517424 RepID=A0A2P8HQH5_9BACI|nr:NAD(P)H-dependent oxidoreductase [Salsuginibacillus halophilus]PSL48469.1 nitroreductase [Salsuginibacillus halophilus]
MDTKDVQKAEILKAFHFRHATKAFSSDELISESDFQFILETGRLSPSSVGLEPWRFLIIQNEDMRDALIDMTPGGAEQLKTASHFVIILSRRDVRFDSDYFKSMYTEVKGMPEETFDEHMVPAYEMFQGDMINILTDKVRLLDWSQKQTYIALGNMMTAAAQIGIDSCPIEGFDYDRVRQWLIETSLMDPNRYDVSVMAAFGYRAEDPPREKSRLPLEELVTYI